MKKTNLFLALFVVFIINHLCEARYKMATGKPVKVVAPSAAQPAPRRYIGNTVYDENSTLLDLSNRFGVDLNRLQYLRGLRYGYELLVPALVVAHDSQADVGRILKFKMDGASWEKVCDEFMVDTKVVDKEAIDVLVPLRKTLPKLFLTEKPESR